MKVNLGIVAIKVVSGIIILVGVFVLLVGCTLEIVRQLIPSVSMMVVSLVNPPLLVGRYTTSIYTIWKGILIMAAGGGLWTLVALLETTQKLSRYLVAVYNLLKPYQPD